MKSTAAAFFFAIHVSAGATVAAQPARPAFVGGIQGVELSRGTGGAVAFAETLFTLSSRARFSAGLAGGRIGDVKWGFVRLGLLVDAAPGLLASIGTDVGAGNQGLDYRHVRAELAYRPATSWIVVLHAGDQYLDALGAVGNLVSLGIEVHPTRSWRGELTWHRSTGGSLVTNTASLRVDYEPSEGRALFGGVSVGRQGARRPEVADVVPSGRQVFVGVRLPFRMASLTFAIDYTDLGPTNRVSGLAAVRVPL